MSTLTRFQRLRAKRQSRSAAREQHALSGNVSAVPTSKSITSELRTSGYAVDSLTAFTARQQTRQSHHVKRNLRKNNPRTQPKVKHFSQVQQNQRNITLRLVQRPADMPQELFKRMRQARKELVNAYTKAKSRNVPTMSNWVDTVVRNQKNTRYQTVPVLAKKRTKEDLAGPNNKQNYRENDLHFYSKNSKDNKSGRKTGWYRIISYKRVSHVTLRNKQVYG